MDKQMYNILNTFNKIKNLDYIDKNLYLSFYRFFINNYKKYKNFNDLISVYIILDGKNKLNSNIKFFNKFFNFDINVNRKFIINEINRQNHILNYNFSKSYNNKIVNFNEYKKYIFNSKSKLLKIGYFSIYNKWFNNYVLIRDLDTQNFFKLYLPNNLIDKLFTNDILKLEILKKEKPFWTISKIIDFYPNSLNNYTYDKLLL